MCRCTGRRAAGDRRALPPSALTRGVIDLFLTGCALVPTALAARRRPPRPVVLTVAGLNLAWAVLSLLTPAVRPESTAAATVWIPLRAAVVVLFAVVQLAALPRRP